ncbi:CU044_5270 family protein [Nonomuraea cavernae]|uniref:CU044_5270 family protein n=1 Tax=Nonomuraea cavernae TaxID=2045107 RepID=A0A917YQY4_9ACTN|nr:CU044_5270 family protein [Nonomuraea cavernae]MCA2183945.1 CU044_5270 family protein [Nonomuraea cavernae]GGO61855.1 hypothetical protein GCM10012289_05080 [Nonomuraea cavernae]
MNELELLDRLRAEVPPRQDLRAEEARLHAAIATPHQARRPKRVARLSWGLTLAGATMAAAVLVVPRLDSGPAPDVETGLTGLTAAKVLENAALVAERTDVPAPRPDQWFYLKEQQSLDRMPVFETWWRMDGKRSAARGGDGGEVKVGDEKGRTYPLKTQQEVEAFPADPDALLAHLRGMDERTALSICEPECPAGTEDDVKAFGILQWYMKFGPIIPPDTAATMFRAMARIPNVKIEENVSTADGRTGLGVVLDLGEAGKGYTILDPADYHYLGAKSVRDGEEWAMSVLGAGLVDQPGQTP